MTDLGGVMANGGHVTSRIPLLIFGATLTVPVVLGGQAANPDRDALFEAFNKGHALWEKEGRLAKAVPYFEKAVALAPKVFGPDGLDTADLHNRLGLLYYYTSHFALAET